jgi:hypothetical protein
LGKRGVAVKGVPGREGHGHEGRAWA